jgi:hypothetical protein
LLAYQPYYAPKVQHGHAVKIGFALACGVRLYKAYGESATAHALGKGGQGVELIVNDVGEATNEVSHGVAHETQFGEGEEAIAVALPLGCPPLMQGKVSRHISGLLRVALHQ